MVVQIILVFQDHDVCCKIINGNLIEKLKKILYEKVNLLKKI